MLERELVPWFSLFITPRANRDTEMDLDYTLLKSKFKRDSVIEKNADNNYIYFEEL
jgi:hypothetical protein